MRYIALSISFAELSSEGSLLVFPILSTVWRVIKITRQTVTPDRPDKFGDRIAADVQVGNSKFKAGGTGGAYRLNVLGAVVVSQRLRLYRRLLWAALAGGRCCRGGGEETGMIGRELTEVEDFGEAAVDF